MPVEPCRRTLTHYAPKLNLPRELADIAISPMQPRFEHSICYLPARPAANPFALELAPYACSPGLPALPHSLARMELLLQGAVVNLGAVAEVVKRDAILAAQVLRLANHDRDECDRLCRIEACLAQLDISVLRELVQTTPPLSPCDWRCRALLNHSRIAALAAETIAFQIPELDPEKAYLAGLLHAFPDLAGLSAEAVSCGEIDEWPLPAFIWTVIRGFRHPFTVSARENRLCEVVRTACEWTSRINAPA